MGIIGVSSFVGRSFLETHRHKWKIYGTYCRRKMRVAGCRFIRCDLTRPGDARQAARWMKRQGVREFLYLAANGDPGLSLREPLRDLSQNLLGLVHFLASFEISKLCFFSSGAVYEGRKGPVDPSTPIQPVLPYGISKSAAERYCVYYSRQRRFGFTILRFFGAYGPGEEKRKITTRYMLALRDRRSFILRGGGKNLIDLMHKKDVSEAIHRVLRARPSNRIFDLSSRRPVTLGHLLQTITRVAGRRVIIRRGPKPSEDIHFRPVGRQFEKVFQFRPKISLEEGLKDLWNNLKQPTS